MNMDIFNTFLSRTLFSTNFNNSIEECESYNSEYEKNFFPRQFDSESKLDYFKECYGIPGITGLNIYDMDRNFPNSIQEENDKEMNFVNKKRDREISDKEPDNIVEEKKEDIKSIKFYYNGNKLEDKEIIIEIKEEEENSKNKKQEENHREMKKENENEKKMFKIEKIRKEDKENYTKKGRKKQEDKDKGKNGDHNRDSEDNKMRKIKSFFGKNLYIFIRDSFIDKNEFLKLEISINKNLKKDFNEDLFKKKIKDIYYHFEISEKYVHFDKDINKKLIDKIYKEQKEKAVIKILNLTYIEAFDIFRRKIKDIKPELKNKINGTGFLDNKKFKDFDCLIAKIREEEKNNSNGDIEAYINDIKRLCLEFEEWFGKKIGRSRKDNADKFD